MRPDEGKCLQRLRRGTYTKICMMAEIDRSTAEQEGCPRQTWPPGAVPSEC